jgi:hypothetical protein
MHAAAALNKKALVCWGGTSPEKLGYNMHKNLRRKVCPTPECHRPNSYLFDTQSSGFLWDCKYSDECMNYTADEILENFKILNEEVYDMVDVKADDITPIKEEKECACDAADCNRKTC